MKLDKIAVAITQKAILHSFQQIPFIGGATPKRQDFGVGVERPIGRGHKSVVGAVRSASRRPIPLHGIEIKVVIRVHAIGEAHLLFVTHTGRLESLGFGLGQSRKQQGREDGDDRNHNEQFDQGKTSPPPSQGVEDRNEASAHATGAR